MHRRLRPLAATALVSVVAFCSPIARGVFAQSFGNAIQTAETERFLIDAPIVRLGKTLGGVTFSRQAILELNGTTRFAVWKTIDEKKSGLTEFAARGGEINFQDSWRTEVPAYELDKLLEPPDGPGHRRADLQRRAGVAAGLGRSRDVGGRTAQEEDPCAGSRSLESPDVQGAGVRQPDLQHRSPRQQHLGHQGLDHHPDRPFTLVPPLCAAARRDRPPPFFALAASRRWRSSIAPRSMRRCRSTSIATRSTRCWRAAI